MPTQITHSLDENINNINLKNESLFSKVAGELFISYNPKVFQPKSLTMGTFDTRNENNNRAFDVKGCCNYGVDFSYKRDRTSDRVLEAAQYTNSNIKRCSSYHCMDWLQKKKMNKMQERRQSQGIPKSTSTGTLPMIRIAMVPFLWMFSTKSNKLWVRSEIYEM